MSVIDRMDSLPDDEESKSESPNQCAISKNNKELLNLSFKNVLKRANLVKISDLHQRYSLENKMECKKHKKCSSF